jgi:hypothetical protein
MHLLKKRIDEIKSQGYNIDFGDVFNQTIETIKKLLCMAVSVPFMFCCFILGLAGIFAVILEPMSVNYFKSRDFKPEI